MAGMAYEMLLYIFEISRHSSIINISMVLDNDERCSCDGADNKSALCVYLTAEHP